MTRKVMSMADAIEYTAKQGSFYSCDFCIPGVIRFSVAPRDTMDDWDDMPIMFPIEGDCWAWDEYLFLNIFNLDLTQKVEYGGHGEDVIVFNLIDQDTHVS